MWKPLIKLVGAIESVLAGPTSVTDYSKRPSTTDKTTPTRSNNVMSPPTAQQLAIRDVVSPHSRPPVVSPNAAPARDDLLGKVEMLKSRADAFRLTLDDIAQAVIEAFDDADVAPHAERLSHFKLQLHAARTALDNVGPVGEIEKIDPALLPGIVADVDKKLATAQSSVIAVAELLFDLANGYREHTGQPRLDRASARGSDERDCSLDLDTVERDLPLIKTPEFVAWLQQSPSCWFAAASICCGSEIAVQVQKNLSQWARSGASFSRRLRQQIRGPALRETDPLAYRRMLDQLLPLVASVAKKHSEANNCLDKITELHQALQCLQKLQIAHLKQPNSYRVALAICAQDAKITGSLQMARAIHHDITKKVMEMTVLAKHDSAHWQETAQAKKDIETAAEKKQIIVEKLQQLQDIETNLVQWRRQLSSPSWNASLPAPDQSDEEKAA